MNKLNNIKPNEKEDHILYSPQTPSQHLTHKITGKYEKSFGIHNTILSIIKQKMISLYNNSSTKNIIYPEILHAMVLDIFNKEYYPDISKNLHIDKNNAAVIMGGVAFNQNIPIKLSKFLEMETDDIDLKVYTTEITPNNLDKPHTYKNTMSLFKFISLIPCMYLKQIMTYIINLEDTIFSENTKQNTHIVNNIKQNKTHTHKTFKNIKNKSKTLQNGGVSFKKHTKMDGKLNGKLNGKLISYKQKFFGILKRFKVIVEIKNHNNITNLNNKEIFDITNLNYEEIVLLLQPKINNPDILITTKIQYFISYSKVLKTLYKRNKITFSDCKIIYPSVDYPTYYTYYLMNVMNDKRHAHYLSHHVKNSSLSLEQLFKHKLTITDVIDIKSCKNQCRFSSIKSLLIDSVLMLSYAELLLHEKLELYITEKNAASINLDKLILVKIGCIFKYYKYLIKFIRLHIIRKFYDNTLVNNKDFIETAKKLIRYTNTYLKRETTMIETDVKNIEYRAIIKNFHKSFFIDGDLMRNEFKQLEEIVHDYRHTVEYLNKSRFLFKDLDKDSDLDSMDSIMILLADKDSQKQIHIDGGGCDYNSYWGGSKTNKQYKKHHRKPIILHSNYNYDDIQLDNDSKHLENNKAVILDKIDKITRNELKMLNLISKAI